MSATHSGRIVTRLVGLAVLVGCTPHIELRAEPRLVCEGGTVRVSWTVTKGLFKSTKFSTTRSPGDTSVNSSDSLQLTVTVPMIVMLQVSNLWWHTQARAELVVLPKDSVSLVPFIFRGITGDSLETRDSLPLDLKYRIQSVTNVTGWPIRIHHAGIDAVLADSASTVAFAGLAATGEWTTRMPRTLIGAAGTRPRAVQLMVRMGCGIQ